MKFGKKILIMGGLIFGASAAHATSGLYEVDVYGLQGLNILEGAAVWQPSPVYPSMALRRRLEGEVLVQYTISPAGKAENIEILDASPRGFFDNATIHALESATFGVTYDDGQAVPVEGIQKRFVYKIEETNGESRPVAAIQ